MIEKVEKAYRIKTDSNDYIYIGDPDGKSEITLNRWDGECCLKLNFEDKDIRSYRLEDNKVKWETPKLDYHFYPVEKKTVIIKFPQREKTFIFNELGGLEFEIVLKEKPSSNEFIFPIETKNLEFYYQPPLTEEYNQKDCEIYTETHIKTKDGVECFRPPQVVGSYAVYHATKTNIHFNKTEAEKYRVGKAFHIYRPKITDAKGNSEWCNLHIDKKKGILVITVPENFLNAAAYPATIDPNFGYETAGRSDQSIIDRISGSWFTCPEAGTGDSITAYIGMDPGPVAPPPTQSVRYAIYKKSDNSFVEETEEYSSTSIIKAEWITLNLLTSPSLQNIDYWLVAWGGSTGSGDVWLFYDSDTNGGYQDQTYNSFPDPWSPTSENKKYSIYCTYTAAAAPPKHPITHLDKGPHPRSRMAFYPRLGL